MHVPIVVSLLVILVAMVPAVGVSLIATRRSQCRLRSGISSSQGVQ